VESSDATTAPTAGAAIAIDSAKAIIPMIVFVRI
jgi:hypothetical protein